MKSIGVGKAVYALILRRKLKFLLVDFLIGRHAESKIRELTARTELIVKSVKGYFEGLLNACGQVDELGISETFVDALCGRVPKSMPARH